MGRPFGAWLEVSYRLELADRRAAMKESDRDRMEILEAFDATGWAHSAALLAGVNLKTGRRYVAARDAGLPVDAPVTRAKLIDAFL